MRSDQLDAIRRFEGFEPEAKWDYKQVTNGYGTRAKYAGEVIGPEEAERRFQAEIGEARRQVLKFCPNLDDGTVAALTSLTFNTGSRWMQSGLGSAVKAGDLETARDLFKQYVRAGGSVLSGLVARREFEARWIGSCSAEADRTAITDSPNAGFISENTARSFGEILADSKTVAEATATATPFVRPCEPATMPNYDLLTLLANLLHFASPRSDKA